MEKLLFTGASGFLGNNLKPLLEMMYEVTTLGLADNDDIKTNLAKKTPSFNSVYDVVLHAAGKAHIVPKTAIEKQSFYDVNLKGTKNLCSALERMNTMPKAFIFISTVAVYGCESGCNIMEDHPLKGKTPYAESKKLAEAFLTEWCKEHDVKLGIIRPSLIAGQNAPGNLGAMVNGIRMGKYLSIAGGKARKSVVMVQDIANLVPLLATKGGTYNVCDSRHPTFRELETLISIQLNKRLPLNIPYCIAKCLALVGDCLGEKAPINSFKLHKIYNSLTFSNEKAIRELNWKPMNVIDHYKI